MKSLMYQVFILFYSKLSLSRWLLNFIHPYYTFVGGKEVQQPYFTHMSHIIHLNTIYRFNKQNLWHFDPNLTLLTTQRMCEATYNILMYHKAQHTHTSFE